jgi:hypothetical protein
MKNTISRRDFLKGAAGTAAALPLLNSLPAHAQGTGTPPKRLVVFFTPNGTNPEPWFPTPGASPADFTLGRIHAPLLPHQNDLILTRGIDMLSPVEGPGEPHQKGMGSVLTGTHLQEGSFVGGDGTLAGWGNGISVDQRIAQVIGDQTRLSSLEMGVRVTGSEVRHRLNYAGPANPLQPDESVNSVWARLFEDLAGSQQDVAILRAERRSVLDAVLKQFSGLRSRISAADRQKLDAHWAMVRDIETRLDLPQPGACDVPGAPPYYNPGDEDNMDEILALQIDLLVSAFACDQTRVATLQISSGANNIRYPHLSSFSDDHQLSHAGASDTTAQEEWVQRKIWLTQHFALLLDKLKAIPEGDGTMLDNTVVFWVSDIAQGNTHSHYDMPFVLAGSLGGVFQTGRYHQFTDVSHCNLLLSILHGFGIPDATFGDPNYCSGIIPELFA